MVINRSRYRIIPQYEKTRRQVKARNTTRTAVLGDETQNIYSDRIGYYFARPIMGADDNGNARLGDVFYLRANPAAGIMPRPGYKVFYKQNERGQEVIVSADLDDLEQKKVDARALEANDPYRAHRYLFELVNLKSESIDSGLLVNCYPWQYQTSDNTVHFFGGTTATTHVDLEDNDFIGPSAVTAGRTSIMPTVANTRRFALLVFNITKHLADDYPLEVYPGVAQTIAPDDPLTINDDLQTCYDVLPTDEIIIPIKAYYLEHGQTEIAGISKDIDVRQFINVPSLDSGGITQLTGDVTAGPGSGSQAATLATVNSNVGTFTYATVTVNGKGLVTAASSGAAPLTSFSETLNYLSAVTVAGAVTLSSPPTLLPAYVVATHPTNPSVAELRALDPAHIPFLDASIITSGTFPINIPIDMLSQTAGENWSARDHLYLNPSTGSWFKADNDAISMSAIRGVATASATSGTTNNRIRRAGLMTGYAGLTANAPVYLSSTAGGLTQTLPTPSLDGSVIAIAEYGHALSTTTVWVDCHPGKPVIYRQYVTSSAGETTTIDHHVNPAQSRTFSARTYVYDEVSIETYASSNQDANKQLKGQSGAGTTTTPSAVSNATFALGDSGGNEFEVAQSMTFANAGQLSSFTVNFGATTGTPSQAPIWEFCQDNAGNPGTVLSSGTMPAITPSSDNTVSGIAGVFVVTGTTYHLKLRLPAQSTNNFYTVTRQNTNPYASGVMKADQNSAGTWSALAAGSDMRCSVTLSAVTLYDRIAQGFSHSSGATLLSGKLWLRKVGSPTGNLKLSIFSDTGGVPNTLITSGDSDVIDASTLGTSYAWVTFTYSTPPSISASTQYHQVLSTTGTASNTNYVEWGIDTSSPSYANGVLTSDTGGTWSTATPAADAIFDVIAQGTQSEEDLSLGQYTGGTGQYGVRRGSSTGTNPSTQTTFKNISGESMPIVYDVYVP